MTEKRSMIEDLVESNVLARVQEDIIEAAIEEGFVMDDTILKRIHERLSISTIRHQTMDAGYAPASFKIFIISLYPRFWACCSGVTPSPSLI